MSELFQSTDAGRVWNEVDSYFDDGFCLAQDPNDPDKVYAGGVSSSARGQASSISISTDGGKTWRTRKTLPAASNQYAYNAGCRSIYVTRGNSDIVYAGGSNGGEAFVCRSDNGGNTWTNITNNLMDRHPPNSYDVTVETILCDPRNEETVYAGTSENLFVSTNNGSSWHETGLNHPTKSLLYDPVHEVLYAGTMDDGVYYSENGLSWEPLGDSLQRTQCLCLGINPETGTLYVGTYGRATWRFTHPVKIPDWSLY